MNKPEKKKMLSGWDGGYNNACEEWEKYHKEVTGELLEACKEAKLWHNGDKWRYGNNKERADWTRFNIELEQAIAKAEEAE